MDRIATALKFLAVVIVGGGFACLYLIHRPADLGAAWTALGSLVPPAGVDPLVVICAVGALVTTVGARLLERDTSPGRPAGGGARPIEIVSALPEPVAAPRAAAAAGKDLARHLQGRRPDVKAFVDGLLGAAAGLEASDVHLQPLDLGTRITLRIRGELVDFPSTPRALHDDIVRRLKILAQLITYKTDLPQDGRFALDTSRGAIDVRMAVLPTRHGEKVVLRLSRAGHGLIELARLGLPAALREQLEDILREPQGLIVLTGPAGSGKTTTLYASLAHIHDTRGEITSIASIEDPIEIDLPFLSQTQVDAAAGLDFGTGLRSILRQDPNVLMIGEVRDRETARTAVQAGLTGHLILTTLHAESTAGIFSRLIDIGVEPFLASSSVLAGVSQRLARRLCEACRRPAAPGRSMVRRLVKRGITQVAAENLSCYTAAGCEACGKTGLAGRTAIFELLRVTPALRELIARKVPTQQIEEAARAEGMTPLLEAAVLEVVAGNISLEEALRIAG